jgi:hypothetical protein
MTKDTLIRLEEAVNMDLVKSLMKKCITKNENEKTIYDELEGIRSKIKKNRIVVKYDYKRVIKGRSYGRLYPTKESGIFNYCCMKSDIRSYLAQEYYKYIDLSCCHANILNDLTTKYGIVCSELSSYCSNREAIIAKYNLNKKTINEHCNLQTYYGDNAFFKKIHNAIYESSGIFERVSKDEYFKPLLESLEKEALVSKDFKNTKGKFIAIVCQTYESFIITKAMRFLEERGTYPNSYIYDGLLFKKEYNVDLDILNDHIKCQYNGVTMNSFFKYESFDISKQYLEIFNRDQKPEDPLNNEEGALDLTDNEVAEAIYKEHLNYVINNNGIFYAFYKHEWVTDIMEVFESWISECDLNICQNPKKPQKLVKSKTSSWDHYKKQLKNIALRKLPIVDILDKETSILPFLNGIYNLKTKSFILYEDSDIHYFSYKVNRDFPTDRSKYDDIKKIFTEIFNDDSKCMTEVFNFICRALGKHTVDKLALQLIGERNSGKGFIMDLISFSFPGITGNLMSEELILKKGTFESSERKHGFLAPVCENLICIAQEIKENCVFDGAIWRTLVSGGDEVSYRTAYGKCTTKRIRALCLFGSNSIMNFNQPDSSSTLLVYNMPCKFVDKFPENKVNSGFVYKLKNPNYKELCKKRDYIDAFTLLLLDYYIENIPEYPILKESAMEINEIDEELDDGELLIKKIRELYTIKLKNPESIKCTIVHQKMLSINGSFRPVKIESVLLGMGVRKKTIRGTRFYEGVSELIVSEIQ